ncbi:unnamed protein product, partial [Porites lobata]
PNRIYCTCKSTCSTKRTSTEVSCGQDCKCGSQSKPCRNKFLYCCGQRRCVTTFARFSKLCLDPDVLEIEQQHSDDNSTQGPSGRLHTGNLFLIVMDI